MTDQQRIAEITAEYSEAKADGAKGYMIPVSHVEYLLSLLAARDAEIERLRQHENTILIDHSHRFTEAGVRGLLEQIKTFNEVCLEHQQERLQREEEIRQLREAQRWIPVSERLPEDGARVLVRETYAGGKCGVNILRFAKEGERICKYSLKDENNIFYALDSEYGYYSRSGITHWMPLPAAPDAE